jgi:hypothetical protein
LHAIRTDVVVRWRLHDVQLAQPIAIGVGQRGQQDGVDHREHRGGAADAERQGEDGEDQRPRAAAQAAPRIANRT